MSKFLNIDFSKAQRAMSRIANKLSGGRFGTAEKAMTPAQFRHQGKAASETQSFTVEDQPVTEGSSKERRATKRYASDHAKMAPSHKAVRLNHRARNARRRRHNRKPMAGR